MSNKDSLVGYHFTGQYEQNSKSVDKEDLLERFRLENANLRREIKDLNETIEVLRDIVKAG